MAYGDKPKRQKDDMGNKGRRSGKGPKPMKGARKASRESAKQERKNLIKENPVVNRSNDSGFDYTQSKKDIKKRYKKMDKAKAQGVASIPHGSVSRFVGSTKPLGNTEAINAMMKQTIKKGLAADLGTKLAQAAVKTPIGSGKAPSMTAPKIKQPLAKNITKVTTGTLDAIQMSPEKITGSFKPSERDMALKEAHLSTPAQQSASPAKLTRTKAGGPVKPKVKKKRKKKKRTIKAKF